MKTSSCKAKGRKACQEAKETLLWAFPELEDGDIQVTSSGSTGEDLKLSPKAQKLIPLVFEIKNQERLNIWEAYEQAVSHLDESNVGDIRIPTVVFRRNRSNLMVCLDFESFSRLISESRTASERKVVRQIIYPAATQTSSVSSSVNVTLIESSSDPKDKT
jgi:hypothetical protein